jgi:hypothetical protein
MNLHFITSISKNYWNETGKYCISTWTGLPGKITVYVDQKDGDLDWLKEIPFHKELLFVPPLEVSAGERAKVRKFWGKSMAQITALRNRGKDERIIWIDADVEKTASSVPEHLFAFEFTEPLAMMNSQDQEDCWESGIVVFNQKAEKFDLTVRKYEKAWLDEDTLLSLWRPYDAQVLGHIATERGFLNLCQRECPNAEALQNSPYAPYFKHWINKDNKKKLAEKNT